MTNNLNERWYLLFDAIEHDRIHYETHESYLHDMNPQKHGALHREKLRKVIETYDMEIGVAGFVIPIAEKDSDIVL